MTDTDVVSPASGEPDLDADVIHGSVDVEGMPREYTAVVPHDLPADAPNVCEWSGVAVPTMVVLGTADPISPFEGGQAGSFAGKLGEVMAAEDSAAFLAERSGASGEPEVGEYSNTDASGESDVTRYLYDGDAPVVAGASNSRF